MNDKRALGSVNNEDGAMLVSSESVNTDILVGDLNDLIQMHKDLMVDYESASPWLDKNAYKKVFGDFKENHSQSVLTITQLIRKYGGKVGSRGDGAELPAKASATFDKSHNDARILETIKVREERLKLEYVRDIASLASIPEVEVAFKQNKGDTTKRLGWFEGELNLLAHIQHGHKG